VDCYLVLGFGCIFSALPALFVALFCFSLFCLPFCHLAFGISILGRPSMQNTTITIVALWRGTGWADRQTGRQAGWGVHRSLGGFAWTAARNCRAGYWQPYSWPSIFPFMSCVSHQLLAREKKPSPERPEDEQVAPLWSPLIDLWQPLDYRY